MDLGYELAEAVRLYVTRRTEEIKSALTTHQNALKQDSAARTAAKAAAERKLTTVRTLIARSETLLEAVASRPPEQGADPTAAPGQL